MGISPPLVLGQLAVPPLPPATISRPRLTAAVNQGLQGPVTLVCGAAGSGKTVLVSSAVAGTRVAWVSIDREHNDPGQLWAALQRALAPEPGTPTAELTYAPGPAFGVALVNALATLPEQAVLLLDDVHALRSRASLAWLSFLVLHAPPTVRLLFSSRSDPVLPLHLLRVHGSLTEIRSDQLAFTEDEAAELFEAHGVALEPDQVSALHRRTEGWAAGLRLAALTLQRREDAGRFVTEFAGDDRVVADYLVAEALKTEPPRRRAFLMRASIVSGRMCAELTDAITGDPNAETILEDLARTNGFVVPLDPQGRWFRLHRLFGELLSAMARRELASELPALHRRAALWFAGAGEPWNALDHAVAADEPELVGALMLAHWVELSADALRLQPFLEVATGPAALKPLVRLRRARVAGDLAAAEAAVGEVSPALESVVRLDVAITAFWAGASERAEQELADTLALAVAGDVRWAAAEAAAHLALHAALRSGPVAAGPLLAEARRLADGRSIAALDAAEGTCALFARRPAEAAALLAAARAAALDAGLAELLEDPSRASTGYAAIEALLLEAMSDDDPRVADVAIGEALARAEATGHRSVFATLGERGADLLRRQVRQGTDHAALASELLTLSDTAAAPARCEPLTEREQAVLRLLPSPLSAQEIASELSISRNTVKTHLRSLYRKLDAADRRDAVDNARRQGLLPRSLSRSALIH